MLGVIVPDMLGNRGAAQDLAWMAQEILQERVFLAGEGDDALASAGFVRQRIERDIQKAQQGCPGGAITPEQGAHPGFQLTEGKGLGEIVIRTQIESLHALIYLAECSQEQNGHRLLLLAQLSAHLKAIE